ncbi:MAG: uroporphyrinogen-III C-methyltransferase [Deltaproteobacteria bacterium]|nr:uroporphyrinogen-III C-methyltransferase [Deltaproteobacteria bacterium]
MASRGYSASGGPRKAGYAPAVAEVSGSGSKVYVVGAGPGDPGLVTLRGLEILGRADVVLYDALVDPAVLGLAPEAAVKIDVGKHPGSGGAGTAGGGQDAINARMIDEARGGRTVVRLKAGDPTLFARYFEEIAALERAGVAFEVVPGISSVAAAAAYAGIPLTQRDCSSSVLLLTGHAAADGSPPVEELRRAALLGGTLAILMGMRHLDEVARALVEGGLEGDTPVAVVQWASRPEQATLVSTLAAVGRDAASAGLSSPAVVFVGPVVGLRESLRWFDRLPLFGRRVLVLRAAEQSGRLAELLRDHGALPIEVPAIRVIPPEDEEPVRRAVRNLGTYGVVVFTSANAVRWLMKAVQEEGGDSRRFGQTEICAIGPATVEALASYGLHADVVPAEHDGEALARAILEARPPGVLRVLLPRARDAREELPRILREAGASVDVVAVYRTVAPDEEGNEALRAAAARADVVTLSSGSTVTNLVAALGSPDQARAILEARTVASIGKVTTEAALRAGLRVDVTAAVPTIASLVTALSSHFTKNRPTGPGRTR